MITFKDRQRHALSFIEAFVPQRSERTVIRQVLLELRHVQPWVVRIRRHFAQYRLELAISVQHMPELEFLRPLPERHHIPAFVVEPVRNLTYFIVQRQRRRIVRVDKTIYQVVLIPVLADKLFKYGFPVATPPIFREYLETSYSKRLYVIVKTKPYFSYRISAVGDDVIMRVYLVKSRLFVFSILVAWFAVCIHELTVYFTRHIRKIKAEQVLVSFQNEIYVFFIHGKNIVKNLFLSSRSLLVTLQHL